MRNTKYNILFRLTGICVLMAFGISIIVPLPPVYAQSSLDLPPVGTMVHLSPAYVPPTLKGIIVHPENPFQFDFILDSGDTKMQEAETKSESEKLIKYFLTALTLPENDLWVNLSPYEADRIIPDEFGQTEMGQVLLEQDYLLKQLTASLMNPEGELGEKFWDKVYKRAYEEYGVTDIPIDTFNKVWIVPSKALVYENVDRAFVVESHLKVMLEEDYVAMSNNVGAGPRARPVYGQPQNAVPTDSNITTSIMRNLIIPQIEHEVNKGHHFAKLRQVYHSFILASWYKKNLKASVLNQAYSDQKKIGGLETKGQGTKKRIYNQYLKAFKTGVYDLIKEEYDANNQKIFPRKYFSGGLTLNMTDEAMRAVDKIDKNNGYIPSRISVILKPTQSDLAMMHEKELLIRKLLYLGIVTEQVSQKINIIYAVMQNEQLPPELQEKVIKLYTPLKESQELFFTIKLGKDMNVFIGGGDKKEIPNVASELQNTHEIKNIIKRIQHKFWEILELFTEFEILMPEIKKMLVKKQPKFEKIQRNFILSHDWIQNGIPEFAEYYKVIHVSKQSLFKGFETENIEGIKVPILEIHMPLENFDLLQIQEGLLVYIKALLMKHQKLLDILENLRSNTEKKAPYNLVKTKEKIIAKKNEINKLFKQIGLITTISHKFKKEMEFLEHHEEAISWWDFEKELSDSQYLDFIIPLIRKKNTKIENLIFRLLHGKEKSYKSRPEVDTIEKVYIDFNDFIQNAEINNRKLIDVINDELKVAKHTLKKIEETQQLISKINQQNRPLIIWQFRRQYFPYLTDKIMKKMGVVSLFNQPVEELSKEKYILVNTGLIDPNMIMEIGEFMNAPVLMSTPKNKTHYKNRLNIKAIENKNFEETHHEILEQKTFFIEFDTLGPTFSFDTPRLNDILDKTIKIGNQEWKMISIIQKIFTDAINKDLAMAVSAKGGIDLNQDYLDLQTQGNAVDMSMFTESMQNIHIENGLVPVINSITPVTNLQFLFTQSRGQEEPLPDVSFIEQYRNKYFLSRLEQLQIEIS